MAGLNQSNHRFRDMRRLLLLIYPVLGLTVGPVALLADQGEDEHDIDAIEASCNRSGGSGEIPAESRKQLESIGKIPNIGWIADGAQKDATIICPRSSSCPRDKHCLGRSAPRPKPQVEQILESIRSSS